MEVSGPCFAQIAYEAQPRRILRLETRSVRYPLKADPTLSFRELSDSLHFGITTMKMRGRRRLFTHLNSQGIGNQPFPS